MSWEEEYQHGNITSLTLRPECIAQHNKLKVHDCYALKSWHFIRKYTYNSVDGN